MLQVLILGGWIPNATTSTFGSIVAVQWEWHASQVTWRLADFLSACMIYYFHILAQPSCSKQCQCTLTNEDIQRFNDSRLKATPPSYGITALSYMHFLTITILLFIKKYYTLVQKYWWKLQKVRQIQQHNLLIEIQLLLPAQRVWLVIQYTHTANVKQLWEYWGL